MQNRFTNEIMSASRVELWRRAVSFVLALLLFASNVPFDVFSVGNTEQGTSESVKTPSGELTYDYDTLKITRDGKDITNLSLYDFEKIEIAASGVSEEATYQWQVQHPEKEDVWVNIYDGTKQTIGVSLALVENVLQKNGYAKLRCRAYTDTYAYLSNTITVQVLEQETVTTHNANALRGSNDQLMPLADEPTPEFVTITIEYVQYDFERDAYGNLVKDGEGNLVYDSGKQAFTSYVATIHGGTDLDTNVTFPTMIGYDSYFGSEVTPSTSYHIQLTDVTENVVYTVRYLPAEVDYVVRYFFQNIYDDLYVENTDMKVDAEGFTGSVPPDSIMDKLVPGFTSLYYQPDAIAADGSTIFEVYYERNYYLMEFDCDGGYGTETVYVRYGSYISVPQPVRTGYVFNGWDLVKAEDDEHPITEGDGSADPLATTMPPYNSGYKALWTTADTTYTVAYWILDSNGNKTYIGSRIVNSISGDTVNGEHDLASQTNGGPAICGYDEHTHTDDCYICGFTDHIHTTSCFDGMTLSEVSGADSNRDAAINDLEDGGGPQSGYIYVIYNHAESSKSYWPKLYLDGKYYIVNGVGDGDPYIYNEAEFSSIIDGEVLSSKTGNYGTETLTTTKYRPKTTCNTIQHSHNYLCRTCEEHTHDEQCYQDEKHLLPVDTFTYTDEDGNEQSISTDTGVTVEGDGSTVVNVYYQYKEYTLKFYYARTTGGTDSDGDGIEDTGFTTIQVVGGSTWNFGTSSFPGPEDGPQLNNVGNWGEITGFPTLNTKGTLRGYEKGKLVYNGYTYHYISFKARYGENIADLWPCAVFNSATRKTNNTHGYWSGTEAFVSAWNGEHYVKYTQENTNETIKGNYEVLDDDLLFYSGYTKDYDEVSFLSFWENGDDVWFSVPELYRYNIWLETISSEISTDDNGNLSANGLPVVYRDGTYYKLVDTYDTCDDSSVSSQTQVSLVGYEPITFATAITNYQIDLTSGFEYMKLTGTTDENLLQSSEYFNSTLYRDGYDINFYYTSTRHSLKFYNYNGWLGSGAGAGNSGEGGGVSYGTPMSIFGDYVNAEGYMDSHYPLGLEPGAYVFAGWYTSPGCLDGTEVDWENMTMPDADLTLYAKWTPFLRNVTFYSAYSDIPSDTNPSGNTPFMSATGVPHGTTVGSSYLYTPEWPGDLDTATNGGEQAELYDFVGWFYMDEDNKKRFAPDSMEITRDLVLFAEWQTSIDTTYEVKYVLRDAVSEENTQNNMAYPAGAPVGETITAHSSVGKTKTFSAKGLGELYEAFRKKFFPTVNTHSILMEPNSALNTYTFEYVYDDTVYYKVRYVDFATRTELRPSKVNSTDEAIITEKFLPIEGYIPQSFYIRKALAYDGNATESSVIEENVLTFYYVKDTQHGLYSVEYYLESENSTDPSDLDNYYVYESIVGSGDLNTTYTAPSRTYTGFQHKPGMTTVITYNADGTEKEKLVGVSPSGTIEYTGLSIKIYYERIEYPYIIEYREYGSEDTLRTISPADASANYDSEVSHTAVSSFELDGILYEYYIDNSTELQRTKTITIRDSADGKNNTLIFYFKKHQVEVYYTPVCKIDGATDFGVVSMLSEYAATANALAGSNAVPGAGFRFKGWFVDEECTIPVNENWLYTPGNSGTSDTKNPLGTKLIPGTLNSMADRVEYFALFEPIFSRLTIYNQISDNAESQDSFLFRVQGTGKTSYIDLIVSIHGNSSVTLMNLPVGDYTITLLTGWSWENAIATGSSAERSIEVTIDPAKDTFVNTFTESNWLDDETSLTNRFTGIHTVAP